MLSLGEGLIEFIPEIGGLIEEINEALAQDGVGPEDVAGKLSASAQGLFEFLPESIRQQMLLDRDAHGNVAVSQIETERLLIQIAGQELGKLKAAGSYSGKFKTMSHFFGYEGRSGLPSLFDSNYCYGLGYNAACLLSLGHTGMMSSLNNLGAPVEEWTAAGVPLTHMMNVERRHGKNKPVIKKALVELDGAAFKHFAAERAGWVGSDEYVSVGPIQLVEPSAGGAADAADIPLFLQLEVFGELRPGHGAATNTAGAGAAGADGEEEEKEEGTKKKRRTATGSKKGSSSSSPSSSSSSSAAAGAGGAGVSLAAERAAAGPATAEPLVAVEGAMATAVDEGDKEALRGLLPHVAEGPLVKIVPAAAATAAAAAAAGGKKPGAQRIGIVFNGRQSPGGHNCVAGLFDQVKAEHKNSVVVGFVDGTVGLFGKNGRELTKADIDSHRNQGGFDLLGRSADKIRSPEEQAAAGATCKALKLDGLVLVGGTFTAGDAANLAEYFKSASIPTAVVCIPCSIDGDVSSPMVEITLGLDTASKVNAQLIGNISSDSISAKKYWHMIKVGRRRRRRLRRDPQEAGGRNERRAGY